MGRVRAPASTQVGVAADPQGGNELGHNLWLHAQPCHTVPRWAAAMMYCAPACSGA